MVKQRLGELWLKAMEMREELLGGQMPLGGHGVPSGHTVPERHSRGDDDGNERTDELRDVDGGADETGGHLPFAGHTAPLGQIVPGTQPTGILEGSDRTEEDRREEGQMLYSAHPSMDRAEDEETHVHGYSWQLVGADDGGTHTHG